MLFCRVTPATCSSKKRTPILNSSLLPFPRREAAQCGMGSDAVVLHLDGLDDIQSGGLASGVQKPYGIDHGGVSEQLPNAVAESAVPDENGHHIGLRKGFIKGDQLAIGSL